jgi:hypothetical protein
LHHGQIQHVIILVAGHHSQVRGEDIAERSRIAIESVEADDDLLGRDANLLSIVEQNLERSQQFAPVIAIACPSKGS